MKTVNDILYIITNFAWAACICVWVGWIVRDNWQFKHGMKQFRHEAQTLADSLDEVQNRLSSEDFCNKH